MFSSSQWITYYVCCCAGRSHSLMLELESVQGITIFCAMSLLSWDILCRCWIMVTLSFGDHSLTTQVKVTNWLTGDSISLVVIHHNALPWATRECNSLRLRHRQHKNRQCEWMRLQLWVKFNFNILSKQSIDSIGKVTVQRKKEKQKTNWLDVIGHTSEERLKATLTQLMCLEGLEMSIIRLI